MHKYQGLACLPGAGLQITPPIWHTKTVSARVESAGSSAGQDLPRAAGRYLLFDHIGRGGMADIYLARATTGLGSARLAVVKEILPELSGDPRLSRQIVEEAKLVSGLSHANVVQVFDLGRDHDRLFIAMEYVEGFDLNRLLGALSRASVPLPAQYAIFIVREVLRALDYAHRAVGPGGEPLGVVHRDVSPSNVLISFEGEVKLCDFGIAKVVGEADDDGGLSGVRVVGKSAYMSPEQAWGGEVDARSDVFAAGILLWELCAGRRLYRGSEEEMLGQARDAVVPPLPDRGLPDMDGLREVLASAMAADPERRFGSSAEMLDALEQWAMPAGLVASPLKLGTFLTEHFADDIVRLRRDRERAAMSLAPNPSTLLPPPATRTAFVTLADELRARAEDPVVALAGFVDEAEDEYREPSKPPLRSEVRAILRGPKTAREVRDLISLAEGPRASPMFRFYVTASIITLGVLLGYSLFG